VAHSTASGSAISPGPTWWTVSTASARARWRWGAARPLSALRRRTRGRLYSLSELQFFCELPVPFPPRLAIEDALAAPVSKSIYSCWNNETSARWEFVLALLALGLLRWGLQLRREGRPAAHQQLRD
jgi:hypothetical protein